MKTLSKPVDWFLDSGFSTAKLTSNTIPQEGKAHHTQKITGYAASVSCILYDRKKDCRFLERAETCAEYMKKTTKDGCVPCL